MESVPNLTSPTNSAQGSSPDCKNGRRLSSKDSAQLRPPLCPIQLCAETQSMNSSSWEDPRVKAGRNDDPVTPREKLASLEACNNKSFSDAENTENATPEKHVLSLSSAGLSLSSVDEAPSVNSRSRYLWFRHQNRQRLARAAAVPTTGKSKCSLVQFEAESVQSMYNTPNAQGNEVKVLHISSESRDISTPFPSITPKTNISRSSKHGLASGSAPSGPGNSRTVMGSVPAKGINPNILLHPIPQTHFDLEEDLSFWKYHNVQVLIRIRPINSSEIAIQGYNRCLRQESAHSVTWTGQPETLFTFDHVACETTSQEKLFHVAGLPIVENCMSGYNSCIFAYGQTGSGKTYTMLGDIEAPGRLPSKERGMTSRVFEYLFVRIKMEEEAHQNERLKYRCRCSFLEIYNEQITDLLEPSSTNLQMREDSKRGVYVDNLLEVEVNNVQDVIQLLVQGASNRKVAATNMNRESSRSHSVFTCVIESKWQSDSVTNKRLSCLHLVDLAGSERQKGSGAEGERLKEAVNINKSLSTLGFVIMILVDIANGKQRHVPYRDSKLTFLLQDSLGGNSKTLIIATASPSNCCSLETLSTLKFAQRAKFIQNNAVVNEDTSADLLFLRQQVQMLKEEVNRLRLLEDSSVASDNISLETRGAEAEDREYPAMLVTKQCQVKNCYCDSEKYASTHEEMLKKLKSFEAVLRGSLRREQIAEDREKYLKVEIEHLNRLVRQREDEAQCGKMMLRFREDKIRRLECLTDGLISADKCFAEERNALTEELHLVSTRIDRNPEVTRFAMENIRLMEQLRRFQDFYEEGERDMMFEEISILRNQFQELLTESYLKDEEKIMMASQIDNYRKDLEKCHRNLNAYMEENANYSRQIMELEMKISLLEVNQNHQHHELEFLKDEAVEPVLQVPSGKCTLEKELHENFCLSCMQSESKISHFYELQTRHDSEIRQLQAQLERVENTFREEETICRHLEKRNFQFSMQLEESKSDVKENMTADADKLSSLYEFEALLKQYRQVFSCVSSSEEREQILKDHIQQIEWKLPEHDFHRAERDINSSNADEEGKGLTDITKMAVFETIKKTSIVELEETGTLNISDEKEKYSALAVDGTIDTLMPGVVTKIADAPTAMLLELSAVTGEFDALDELQQKSQGQVAFLLKELEDLKIKCTELSDENKNLTILYERLFHQKDAETKQLCKEWEDSTAKLINFLSEGDQALNAAAKEIEEMIEESYSDSHAYRRDKEISFRIANKQIAVELLQLKLEEAYSSSKNMEKEMRAFMSNLKNEGETVSEMTLYNLQPMQQLSDKSLKVLPEVLRKHSELPAADERLIESKAETSRSVRKEITDEELAKGGGQQNNLRFKLKDAQVSCAQEGRAVRDLEFDLKRREELIQEREEQMYQEKCDWKKERDQLLLELSKAKLEAAEKTSEAAMVLRRFEACQNTLSEAEFLLNALVKANESAKSEAKCWKDALCSLTQKQTEPLKDLLDPLDYGSITPEQGKEKAIQSMETSLLQDPKTQHCCLEETNLIVDHPCIMEPDDKEVSATSKQVDGVLIDTLADMIHDVLSAVNEMCEQIDLMFSEMSFTKIGIESTLQNLANSWLLLKEDMALKQENESSKTLHEDLEHQRQKIENLEADLSAYCQQACSAESKLVQMEELLAQMNRVEEENCRKDELVECLELDLALIQECTAEWKEEAQQAKATIKFLQQEVDAKAKDMTKMEMKVVDAEVEHEKICKAFQGMMEELQLLREKASVVSNECEDNTEMLELKQKCHCLEEELANKHHAVETLAAELLEVTSHSEMKMALCLESSKQQVDAISKDRDHLKKELTFLGEKLEVSRQLLYEHEIVAAEAHQAADASKRRAEEKESEINLLQGIVLELKRTLHSLEGQVSILKRETEMQHLLREDRELEIQALKHQMSKVIPVVDWNTDDSNRQIAQIDNKEKTPNEMDMHLMELQDQIELLHTELTDKDEQIKNCKSYIIELVAAAELQADEHQKQIKALNYIVEQIKVDQVRATSFSSTLSRGAERLAAKTRRSSSPFKCVKLGISQQITYETEKELFVNRLQIGELQQVALARDKEIFTLKARLAEAESMTHDVLRDLLCVKMDITSYASSLSQQTLQRYAENSHSEMNNAEEKAEICRLRTELDELITERESWLEDINCKQRELKAALIAAEKLQLRDQRLTKDYERLKDEYDRQKKLVSDLGKTRVLLGNVKDTLAYSGIDAEEAVDPEFDYEQLRSTVHKTSQEIESDHFQLAQNLSSLCKSIMQVAGISSGRDPEPSTAMEVLQQLSNRLQSTEQELAYIKLKGRIEGEKKRLSELRGMKSSLKLTEITPIETEATV